MLRRWIAFSLSLMIHFGVIGSIVFWIRRHTTHPLTMTVPVILMTESPRRMPPESSKSPSNVPSSPHDLPSPGEGFLPFEKKSSSRIEDASPPPFDFVQHERTRHTVLYPNPEEDRPIDHEHMSSPFVLKKEWFTSPPSPAYDPVEELIKKRSMDSPPLIPLTRIASPTSRSTPPTPLFDFLPSPVQAACLVHLFTSGSLTDTELYPQINETMTFSAYRKEMEILVEKGWIVQHRVSPQHLLNLFGVPIEMSPQNRRNREYRYHPNVDLGRILLYLDAKCYELETYLQTRPADSSEIHQKIVQLRFYLSRLQAIKY